MNLRKLPFTDDLKEQISIGKELSSSYDEEMISFNYKSLDKFADYNEINMTREELFYRSVYDYWAYGFVADQEIYYRAYEKTHEEKYEYLTHRSRFLYYNLLNKPEDMHMLEDKYEAYQLLKPFYRRDVIKILSEDDYGGFLSFIEKHPSFVVKPLGLSCAMGVRMVNSEDYSDKKALFNELANVGHKYDGDYTVSKCDTNGAVLEEIIVQDKGFAIINPDSCNGIRIATIRQGSNIIVYQAWLKVGVTGNLIASAAIGGLDAGIDISTGRVMTDGYLENGKSTEFHPNTNIRFKGYQIPDWKGAVAFSKELAMSLPNTINYVGWDLVYTPKGWVIIEANYYGDMMWQMYLGHGCRKDFEEMLGWKQEKKFWWMYKC